MSWLANSILFFIILAAVGSISGSFTFLKDGSGTGCLVALALPLQPTVRPVNVFMSYLFEANIFLPDAEYFSLAGETPLKTRVDGRKKRDTRRTLLTRKHTYRMIDEQLRRHGLNGTACLLKTICQTAEADVYENNGLIGDLFHVVFTPSASRDEGLPRFFYEAETLGRQRRHGGCEREYARTCPSSLLEMISDVF